MKDTISTQLTEQEATTNLREAKEILAQFVSKRADHEKHLRRLGEERASVSYDAHRGHETTKAGHLAGRGRFPLSSEVSVEARLPGELEIVRKRAETNLLKAYRR